MGRKYCGKRRNCSLRAISPFPAVFSKDLFCRHVKTRACLGKGLSTLAAMVPLVVLSSLILLPDDKISSLSKLKALADDDFSGAQMVRCFCYRVENIVEKRRKCWLPAFSPFPTMFSKVFFFLGGVKSRHCVMKS